MAMGTQLPDAVGGDGDPVFLPLDFLWYPDLHEEELSLYRLIIMVRQGVSMRKSAGDEKRFTLCWER